MQERELELFFATMEGIGFKKLEQLFQKEASREHLYEMNENRLLELLGERDRKLFLEHRKTFNPGKKYEEYHRRGITFASYWEDHYPAQLRQIADPPKAIYVLGKMPKSVENRIAVIGARACSQYGKRMAKLLGEKLAEQKITLVSGMARGVDGFSQWSALERGGDSIGVLGCGVDVCYPAENRHIYDKLIEQGTVLSEYQPGTMAKATLFPARNRIISALSKAVVVVEAKLKSGTLITVDMALEQGKEIFVVPGRVTDALSEGCNRLILQGAEPLLSTDQLWKAIGMEEAYVQETVFEYSKEHLSIEEQLVYEQLDEYPRSVEHIARQLYYQRIRMEYGAIAKHLITLCRMGIAKQESNLCFVRCC